MVLLNQLRAKTIHISRKINYNLQKMAKSTFEYVKDFELDDKLLPNCWLIVRLDGKCFHKFADQHDFAKPNDIRGLELMNYAALKVMEDFQDVLMAYGQSDEYSFILKKNTILYNRRSSKIMSTLNSKFTSSYVYYWKKFFGGFELKYPPVFDSRVVLYPTDKNLVDYMSWRQADVHVNNLYNTTFWNLVLKGNLSNNEAEKKLSGTLAADKNEILFTDFNINYNNEPAMFRKGTTLLRKEVIDPICQKPRKVVIKIHDDMIRQKFWKQNSELLELGSPGKFELDEKVDNFIEEQLESKRIGAPKPTMKDDVAIKDEHRS